MSDDKSKKRGLFGWFGKKEKTPSNESDSNSTPEELEEKLEQAEEALEQAIEEDLEQQLDADALETSEEAAPELTEAADNTPPNLADRANQSNEPVDLAEETEEVVADTINDTSRI
mgnify:FL=1